MSGGSYEYADRHVQGMADCLRGKDTNPLRKAFAEHLERVAEAMRAVEWVDSCDYARGDEDEPIRAVIAPGSDVAAAVAMAERASKALADAIEAAKAVRP